MWKHHCRVCGKVYYYASFQYFLSSTLFTGGVYCDECCRALDDVTTAAGPTSMLGVKKGGGTKKTAKKICDGCRRGEVPGAFIFAVAEKTLKGKR